MPTLNPPFDMQFNFDISGNIDPESDIKILALNSLMKQNPAQAIPMLRGILSGNGSIQMKRHALFILARDQVARSKSSTGEDVARGKMGSELQREEWSVLSPSRKGAKSNDTLLDIYKTSTDVKVKESVISAMATTQDAPRLVDMARTEKDLKLKRDIVSYHLHQCTAKVAQDYMLESGLFKLAPTYSPLPRPPETTPPVRRSSIDSSLPLPYSARNIIAGSIRNAFNTAGSAARQAAVSIGKRNQRRIGSLHSIQRAHAAPRGCPQSQPSDRSCC